MRRHGSFFIENTKKSMIARILHILDISENFSKKTNFVEKGPKRIKPNIVLLLFITTKCEI